VDRADISRAEHVREIGRDCGKAAAIHGGYYAKGGGKNRDSLHTRKGRRAGVASNAEDEEGKIGCFATYFIGKRRPKKPAANVEQREKADKAAADRGSERLLGIRELGETD